MSVRILNGAESTFYDFDLSYQNGNIAGRLSWDQDNATAQIGLNQNVVARVAQDDMWYVKNQTGASIPKGTVLSAVGTVGASGRILVAPSVGNGSVPAKFILGIAAETIADGADGYVISKGKLRSIDTSLYSAGDVLWLNPSVNGGLTATEPQAPNLKISIAFVVHSSVSAGVLAVRTDSGNDLYDDSRVQMIGTPSTGQLLRYNANRWENWSPNFVTTSRTINIAGTANQVTVVGGTQDLSANRTWTLSLPQNIHTAASPQFDRLGIGTSTFRGAISVAKSISFPNAIPNDVDTWNNTGKAYLYFFGNNNAMAFGLDNGFNSRTGWIQVGHSATSLSDAAGQLRLQPLHGNVSIGLSESATARLDIGGNLRVRTLGTAAGDFVTADANGVFSRRTAAQTLTDIGAQAALTNPVTGTGANGRVAFWTGTNTQSSDAGLFWDNTNKRLGIGTTNPTSLLTLRSSGNSTVRFEDSGTTSVSQITRQAGTGLEFIVSTSARDFFFKENSNNLMVIEGTGNVGIGDNAGNISGLRISRVTGSSNPIPVELQLRSTTNASDFDTEAPIHRISFRIEDTSLSTRISSAIVSRAGNSAYNLGQLDFYASQTNSPFLSRVFGTIGNNEKSLALYGSRGISFLDENVSIWRITDDLIFRTNNTERMRITSTGDVGIGTTSPTAPLTFANAVGNKIDLYYTTASGGDRYGVQVQSSELRIHSGALGVASGGITFGKSSTSTFTEAMRITNAGNVGIGTTSPDGLLEIESASDTGAILYISGGTNSDADIRFRQQGTDRWLAGYDDSPDGFRFYDYQGTAGVRMFLESSTGNVGIGTTSPDSLTHIVGSTAGDGGTYNGSGSILHLKQNTGWSANQPWALFVEGYSYLNGFRINANDGERALYKTAAGGQLGFATSGNDPITFTQSTSTERMRIASGGNVLIGTTTDAGFKLDVNGTGRFTGSMAASNGIFNGVSSTNLKVQNGANANTLFLIQSFGTEALGENASILFKSAANSVDTTYAKGLISFANNGTGFGRGSLIFATNNSTASTNATASDAKLTIASTGEATFSSSVTATSFIKTGGTSSQFLKADGSVDSSTYLTGNQTITLSGDVTGSGATAITTTIANNAVTTAKIADRAVTLAKLPQPSSYSVLGNAAGFTPSNYADIVAGANSILRRDGTGNLTFGSLQTAMIADAAVTFAKISSGSALSVLGRSANSTGVMASIAAGTDGHVLRRSGTTLGFGTIGNASISGLAWSKITSTPTTLAGYGITDALFGINQVQGRVAFWSGVENQVSGSGSFFWDNTNIRLGIGTAAPVGSLDVSRFNTQNDIYFHNGTTYNTTTNVALYFGTANYSAVNNGTTFRYKWWMDGIATGKDLVLSRQQFNGSTVVNTESFRLTSSGAASFAGSLTIGSIANGTGNFLTHSSGLVRSRTAAQVLADLGIQNNVVPNDIVCMTLTSNEVFTTGDLVIPYNSAYTDPTTRYETGGYISVNEGEEWTFTVRTTVSAAAISVSPFTVQIFGADSDKVAVEPYGANINMGSISGTTVVVNVSCIVKIPSGTDFVGVRILNAESQSRTITSGRHLNGFEGKRIK